MPELTNERKLSNRAVEVTKAGRMKDDLIKYKSILFHIMIYQRTFVLTINENKGYIIYCNH